MYCRKCGNRLLDGDRFCSSCGSPIRNVEPSGSASSKGRESERLMGKDKKEDKNSSLEDILDIDLEKESFDWNVHTFPGNEKKKTEEINFDWKVKDEDFRNRPTGGEIAFHENLAGQVDGEKAEKREESGQAADSSGAVETQGFKDVEREEKRGGPVGPLFVSDVEGDVVGPALWTGGVFAAGSSDDLEEEKKLYSDEVVGPKLVEPAIAGVTVAKMRPDEKKESVFEQIVREERASAGKGDNRNSIEIDRFIFGDEGGSRVPDEEEKVEEKSKRSTFGFGLPWKKQAEKKEDVEKEVWILPEELISEREDLKVDDEGDDIQAPGDDVAAEKIWEEGEDLTSKEDIMDDEYMTGISKDIGASEGGERPVDNGHVADNIEDDEVKSEYDEKSQPQKFEMMEDEMWAVEKQIEADLAVDDENKLLKKHTDRIDKFYTFNEKNEEFQKLLDQEYEKFKSGAPGDGGDGEYEPSYEPTYDPEIPAEDFPIDCCDEDKAEDEMKIPPIVPTIVPMSKDREKALEENLEAILPDVSEDGEALLEDVPTKELNAQDTQKEEIKETEEPNGATEAKENVETMESNKPKEGDEAEGKKKGKAGNVAIVVLSIILAVLLFVLAVKLFMPNSGLAEKMDNVTNKVISTLQGKNKVVDNQKKTEKQKEIDRSGKPAEDKAGLIQLQLGKNQNGAIERIRYNASLKYDNATRFANADVRGSKPMTSNAWYTSSEGVKYYLDEGIVGAVIAYESKIADAKGDSLVMSTLDIGEIRKGADGYYVWVGEYNRDSSNVEKLTKKILLVKVDGESMAASAVQVL